MRAAPREPAERRAERERELEHRQQGEDDGQGGRGGHGPRVAVASAPIHAGFATTRRISSTTRAAWSSAVPKETTNA
ncbi:hypothetical protein GCM10009819_29690 [Agromyces tropicus]|uniref:Uncharacterized protein n=1 Tax=Agromyces tropicus TaxID=555371 RepID=A0ABN2URQ9_9MICO